MRSPLFFLGCVVLSAIAAADNYEPIFVIDPNVDAFQKLIVFVPGGKVPPADYVPIVEDTIAKITGTNVAAVIVRCGALNLCNPLGQLPGLMDKAIAMISHKTNTAFNNDAIVIVGHSLGGVGARHYSDTKTKEGPVSFAGLALLGTQYNGDHEDFKGTLGYPMSLKAYPAPLLALLGELDMVPTSHAALLFDEYDSMSKQAQAEKSVVVVPNMDHSQFCAPFNVSGDLRPEMSNQEAVAVISTVMASWMNVVFNTSRATVSMEILSDFVENSTRPITSAFAAATKLEARDVCRRGQELLLRDLPNAKDIVSKLNIDVVVLNSSAPLEHTHTNYSFNADGTFNMKIASYPFYAAVDSWNPVEMFGPNYMSAKDISCKMISADRVAQQFNATGYFPEKQPSATCTVMNQQAIDTAVALLTKFWPKAIERWHRRGRNITIEEDSSTVAGPQWVFLSSLKFDDTKSPKNALVQSPELYSSIASPIYPGNYYCKVLSPAKVIEWIQTEGLESRY